MSVADHKKAGPRSVGCAVVTVSDTRSPATDASGALLRARLESDGHRIVSYEILPDDPARICDRVRALAAADVEAILLSGGTGIAPRDNTYEAVVGVLDRRLDGFGELFRSLSYQEIGAAAMLSRAVAGTLLSTIVFAMPGSTAACELAIDRLVLPELSHIVGLLRPAARAGKQG
ncbi:MAG TPA: molybdenum cofactor biosynthesis protein B [Candidatus Binatia bacterium]|nr:molybdenum cofactor biosynthesis protein B [Candidatus Binatia bacterium]